jgi:hypothetical protein
MTHPMSILFQASYRLVHIYHMECVFCSTLVLFIFINIYEIFQIQTGTLLNDN